MVNVHVVEWVMMYHHHFVVVVLRHLKALGVSVNLMRLELQKRAFRINVWNGAKESSSLGLVFQRDQ